MKISAQGKNLRKIFEEKVTYEIPDYQRPYSWTKDEIEDMFTDLTAVINSESNHFFGAFVFNEERRANDIIEVIDGQQRLTTVAIFLYVLRYLYSMDKFKDVEGVEHRRTKLKEYLEFLDEDGQMIGSKLKLGELNKEFFEEYVVRDWYKSIEEKESTTVSKFKALDKFNASKHIKEGYEYLLDRILNQIKDMEPNLAIKKVKEINDALLKNLEVVEIVVEQDADAFLIFETLNDRGLELSSVDLIKNRLFKNCANYMDFEELKENWVEMIRIIDTSAKKYLRHFWIANYDYVTHQGLFKAVRIKAETYEFSKRLIKELWELSPYYDALHNPTSDVFTHKKLKKVLEDMGKLNFDLTHPILIAGIHRFKSDEESLYKLARLCLNFLIRYISIMKEKPGQIEREIGMIAKKLRKNGQLSDVSLKFQEYAKDSEFKEKLKSITLNYRNPITFYVLTEYEKTLHNETWIVPDRTDVTVEHILPQNPPFSQTKEKDWSNFFTKEEHEVYVGRLGNLTLLGPSAQGRASNKPFEDKKKVYETDTDMLMTHKLVNHSRWTKLDIEKRQEEIAEKAVVFFSLDPDEVK